MAKKRILSLTDIEIKEMESDPNFMGQGKIKHEITGKFKNVAITCVYHGDASNVLQPKNYHRHAIKLRRRDKKTTCVVPYWPPFMGKITNDRELMAAFLRILSASVWGAMDPHEFCHKRNIDPDTKRAEVTYHMYENTFKQVRKILEIEDVAKLMAQLNQEGVN